MFCKIKPIIGSLDEKEKRTALFAARELSRYLRLVDASGDFPVIPVRTMPQNFEHTLILVVGYEALPDVNDPRLDDGIYLDVKGLEGILAGTNARALLIAAYRFLRENGYAFTKPGRHGEVIPDCVPQKRLQIAEKPSYRHRGVCIEGSVYQEGLLELIDWLPKVSMNSYFLQFFEPDVFFKRYYTETEGYALTSDEIEGMNRLIRDAITERGLLFHDVGHGWTCSLLGVDKHDIHKEPQFLADEQRDMLAMVNGKRDFYQHNPLNTNLCYTNPKVIDRMTDHILAYCLDHKEVDYLHFWIADGGNNNCECEACTKQRASDNYVRMLNVLDEKMSAHDLDTKIVFLIYSGLVWAPVSERVKNTDRFVMMFAPFLRDYTTSLEPSLPMRLTPYALNRSEGTITDNAEHLSYYRDWRATFDGDSFDFDYHMLVEFLHESTGYDLAKTLYRDIVNFEELGMNGLICCQNQRVFLPTALGMNVMAASLWNRNTTFEEIVDTTLKHQFADHWLLVKEHLQTLAQYSCTREIHRFGDLFGAEAKEKLRKSIEILNEFRTKAAEIVETEQGNVKQNLECLLFQSELHEAMYRCYYSEDREQIKATYHWIMEYAESRKGQFKTEFDYLCLKSNFFCPTVNC